VLDGRWGYRCRTTLSGTFGIVCLFSQDCRFPSNFGGKARLGGLNSEMEHDVVRDLGVNISIFGEEHKGRPCYHAVLVCVNKDRPPTRCPVRSVNKGLTSQIEAEAYLMRTLPL
jgi:hypothetical protein